MISQILYPLDISDRNITFNHAKTHLSQNGAIPYAKIPCYLMTSIFYMLTDDSPIGYLHLDF
ncbi:MAG: hypothetical protein DRR16_04215 [Candidatus Parabeggiatoa sp. nov. 3]|nr:MAG: hypothetical protein DRR00_15715 [Gammaproteobacteria bacterium]RKZ65656.1 MAG: hypothetical protein DRQ99_12030 [Gammaproteobacteria bacterium]RKZ88746.1 MAG: hypothetical protein DRR16_04215 [Gammaproteobacteria bacterium]